ncbi:MAG: hypothetical protein FD138_178 [Planctomycetota bacterium]|nr:MAG: hypothetical protein FD138_178 [Planctomycetota bacterium]
MTVPRPSGSGLFQSLHDIPAGPLSDGRGADADAELRPPHHRLHEFQFAVARRPQEIEVTAFVRLQHMVDVQPRIPAQMLARPRLPSRSTARQLGIVNKQLQPA